MICVFSKWIKEFLDKKNILAIDKINTKDNVIYLYSDNECVKKAIEEYMTI